MPNQITTSLWGDEGFSAVLSSKSIPEIISIISRDTSPPLYNLSEHIAFQLFGNSEIVIRFHSMFYFAIAIFFVYKIGAFLFGRKTGVAAAVLSALNPFFFQYAFEGRMYSILSAGVIASTYFFCRLAFPFRDTKKLYPWNHIAGYALATSIALYSHHFAIFALFVQGFWFMITFFTKHKSLLPPILIAFVIAGVLYIPWLVPLYNQTKMVAGGFWLGTPTLGDLRELIYKYLATGIKHPLAQYGLYLTFVLILLRKWGEKFSRSMFLTLSFLGPIILAWLISQKFQSIFYDRYLLYTIPFGMLILASNLRKFSIAVLAALILIFAIIDINYFTHPTKLPFRQLADYVKQSQKEDDFLINWNSSSHHLWETIYYGIPAPIYLPEKGNLPFFVGTALMTEADFAYQIPQSASRVGVVTSGAVDEIILPGYTENEVTNFGNLKFIWYVKTKNPR